MNWLKQNWIKIGLAVLVLGVSVFVKEWRNNSPDITPNVASVEDSFDVAKIRKLYTDLNTATLVEMKDREMADYITNIILVKCPFYEPDGASYRMCLDDLREKAESAYNGSESDNQVIRNMCSRFTEDYGGLEASAMYRNCLTYNFSKCSDAVLAQDQYLENEKLSEEFTFEKYKVSNILNTEPADLDINSNRSAREFRTMIRLDLEEGVNYAGHYTIASVGMTGWGNNYWIVDRLNGKAYIFPYLATSLDFEDDSNLIVMDSKSAIYKSRKYGGGCSNTGSKDIRYSDLKPFYFLWDNNELKLLAPTDIEPPVNTFWFQYFN